MKGGPYSCYFRDIGIIAPDAYKKNLALFKKIRKIEKSEKNDKKRESKIEEIKKEIIVANLRLVVKIAKEHMCYCSHLLLDDLIQEGNLGLFKAVDKFDCRKGFQFSTYARWWIMWYIQRAICNNETTIRIPVSTYEKLNKLSKVRHMLQDSNEEETEDIINNLCKFSKKQIKLLENAATQGTVYLFNALEFGTSNGKKVTRLIDVLKCEQFQAPEEIVFENDLREKISMTLINLLTPQEEEVIRRRFGIGALSHETLQEIGNSMKLSRERIRQIEERALNKLRKSSFHFKPLNFN